MSIRVIAQEGITSLKTLKWGVASRTGTGNNLCPFVFLSCAQLVAECIRRLSKPDDVLLILTYENLI